MTEFYNKVKAIEMLTKRKITVENLKDCDAYDYDYYLSMWEGIDVVKDLYTNDLVNGIIELVEGKDEKQH